MLQRPGINLRDSDPEMFQRVMAIRQDPWEFCRQAVYTLDQTDQSNPIKRHPAETEMGPYLKLYTRIWQRERFLLVPKSRRMFMSWQNLALYTHDALWHIGRHHAFVSKKEDDADDLIKRAKFILDNIPESVIPRELIPRYEYVFCELRFPELESKIQGFPHGADQLRAYTFSGILADEMAFWPDAQKMYSSAMPTLEGGGRFTGISSPGPGFFKHLVFDTLDEATG